MITLRPYVSGALLLSAFCAIACSSEPIDTNKGSNSSEEPTKSVEERIIDGEIANDAELAAVVQIVYEIRKDGRFNAPSEWGACSGTLIDSTHVLTAKHCLNETATILVGTDNRERAEAYFAGEAIQGEAEASDVEGAPEIDHDLGMYRLNKPITNVKPIDVDFKPLTTADIGANAMAVGYGQASASDYVIDADQRRKAPMKIAAVSGNVPRAVFKTFDAFHYWIVSTQRTLISSSDQEALLDRADELYSTEEGDLFEGYEFLATPVKGDTCYGDSGGPLLVRKNGELRVVGVVSTGIHEEPTNRSSNRWCKKGTIYASVSAPDSAQFIREFRKR